MHTGNWNRKFETPALLVSASGLKAGVAVDSGHSVYCGYDGRADEEGAREGMQTAR